jgi:hypothetical protein
LSLQTISTDLEACLFTKLDAPLLPQPTARRTRQKCTFDMKAMRQSARLSKKSAMPVMECAQRNMCRKLGLYTDKLAPWRIFYIYFV